MRSDVSRDAENICVEVAMSTVGLASCWHFDLESYISRPSHAQPDVICVVFQRAWRVSAGETRFEAAKHREGDVKASRLGNGKVSN